MLRAAWLGWAACAALFVGAWAWAASGAALYHLKGREAAIAPPARELAGAFARRVGRASGSGAGAIRRPASQTCNSCAGIGLPNR